MLISDIGSKLRYEAIETAAGLVEPEVVKLPAAPELPAAPTHECKNENCPWAAAVKTYAAAVEKAMQDGVGYMKPVSWLLVPYIIWWLVR